MRIKSGSILNEPERDELKKLMEQSPVSFLVEDDCIVIECASLFRHIGAEEYEFRRWAKENDPPNLDNWTAYHPVCRDEWLKRGLRPNVQN